MSLKFHFLLLVLLAQTTPSWGRVFSFANETVAPYVNFRGGLSSMGADPFRWQSASTYAGDEVDLIYGGEFGIYLRGSTFGMAAGVLVHTFDPVAGGSASAAGGGLLYSADVEGISYGGQLVFDYQLSSNESYLWKIIFGGGYQFSKIESTYTMSTAGAALVGGQTSFTESYKQTAPFAVLGVSTEFPMAGTTTLTVTAGYHYTMGGNWEYGQGGQNFAGVHAQGDTVNLENGSAREIDWSYAFIQVGFNFYVDTVR